MIGIINPYRYMTIPSGLIVPYSSSAAIPSGWQVFTSADGKYITVADGSDPYYSIGSHLPLGISLDYTNTIPTFNTNGTIKFYSSQEGGHWGENHQFWAGTLAPDGTIKYLNTPIYADGEHKHLMTLTPTLPYNQMRLIKATANQDKLPKDAIILGHSTLSGLTQMWNNDNKFLKANTSMLAADLSYTLTDDESGNHDHNWLDTGGTFIPPLGSTQLQPEYYTGNHDHALSNIVVTENMKKFYLTAWTNASSAFSGVHGMIAMWESLTPPDGWVICDGTNGTKDLRKYFIMLGSTSNHGSSAGNNTFNITATLNYQDWWHDHLKEFNFSNNLFNTIVNSAHGLENDAHGHSASFINGSSFLTSPYNAIYLPEYYSLVFIQKL